MMAVKYVGGVKSHNVSQLSTRDRLVFLFFFSVCSLVSYSFEKYRKGDFDGNYKL